MIRMRFHGRGGHGIKTASRIVGTAAFLAGRQAQDSPVYGAERRGASVVAFARISQSVILERGVIERPELILIGDETLLDDPAAAVLAGQQAASVVFVNAPSATELKERHEIEPPIVTLDVTAQTIKSLGKASALSAGLGAAAARLTGVISEAHLMAAVREELEHLALPEEAIVDNLRAAQAVFAALSPIELRPPDGETAGQVQHIGYDPPRRSAPSIFAAGNATLRHTGAWRFERPEIDFDLCTRCGLCLAICPEGAISLDENGYPAIDYDHCKGCMICQQQCPLGAVLELKEVRSW